MNIIKNFEITNISDDFIGFGFLNNKKCFVNKSIIGDVVDIKILKETKEYYLSEIINFVKKSDDRIDGQCEYYDTCGGCNMQHFDDKYYYEIKKNYLSKLLKTDVNIEVIKIGCGKRRRVNLKYKNGKYGFIEEKTNNLIEIKKCINLEQNINEIIKLFLNIKLTNLESLDIISVDKQIGINLFFSKMPKFVEFKQLNILHDSVNYINYKDNNDIFIPIFKNRAIVLKIEDFDIDLPNECFLQATKEGQDELIKIVKEELVNCNNVADLYCGIGTYSFPLSKQSKVFAYEGDKNMVDIFKKNIVSNNSNIVVQMKDLFNQPLINDELKKIDGVVINPPRNGASNQCKFLSSAKNIKKIVYVSCNPKTLVKDLVFFENKYKINKIIIVDQFYWSKHIECVVVLNNIALCYEI